MNYANTKTCYEAKVAYCMIMYTKYSRGKSQKYKDSKAISDFQGSEQEGRGEAAQRTVEDNGTRLYDTVIVHCQIPENKERKQIVNLSICVCFRKVL